MVTEESGWLFPHDQIYTKIKADLKATPPTPPVGEFLRKRVPELWRQFYRSFGFRVFEGNRVAFRGLEEGDPAVFWNGSTTETRAFASSSVSVDDFFPLAEKIIRLADGRDCLLVDLGAGTCLQALALRASGSEMPVYNIDLFPDALSIGAIAAKHLKLSGMTFGNVNISGAVKDSAARAHLTQTIKEVAAGRPIIVISRFAMFPFYTPEEVADIFSWVLNDMRAIAGLHEEMCGFKTKSYRTLCGIMGAELTVAAKTKGQPGDPLAYLENLPSVQVVERQELWPHFVSTRFPSFISWKVK